MSAYTHLSLVFSLVTLVFYIIGSIGYNMSQQALSVVPWIVTSRTYLTTANYQIFAGLRGYMLRMSSTSLANSASESSTEHWDNASSCKLNGYATEGLLITALALIFLSIICNIVSLASEDLAPAKIGATVLSFLSFLLGLIGVEIFMNPWGSGCLHRITSQVPQFSFEYGPGAILSTAGFGCALFAFLLNLFSLTSEKQAQRADYSKPSATTTNVDTLA